MDSAVATSPSTLTGTFPGWKCQLFEVSVQRTGTNIPSLEGQYGQDPWLVAYAGTMIQNMIKEGKIVPSEITVKLLKQAMLESGNDKFLIDGFPRNDENRAAFESVTGIVPEFVLFFNCPEEEMERRLLSRNQGREDDNVETIRKRFKVYMESSMPVIEYYKSIGKVRKINAAKPVEAVFEDVKAAFNRRTEKVPS